MKKKKILIVVVIFMLIVFIINTFIFKKLEYDKSIVNKLIYNSWFKVGDKYNTTKIVEYVDPIRNTSILFGEKTVEFCTSYEPEKGEVFEEDVVSKSICTKYDYSVTAKKLTVIVDEEEMIYDYKFDENEQLILTLSGDGYIHNYYYEKNAG